MVSLQSLFCNSNLLTVLPSSIGALKNLTTLSVQRNRLASLPEEMKGLENLIELELQDNELESIPDGLFECKKLRFLNLNRNRISKLGSLVGVVQLKCSGKSIAKRPCDAAQIDKVTLRRVL